MWFMHPIYYSFMISFVTPAFCPNSNNCQNFTSGHCYFSFEKENHQRRSAQISKFAGRFAKLPKEIEKLFKPTRQLYNIASKTSHLVSKLSDFRQKKNARNRPYPYSRYWTETSLQWRLMRS